MASIQVTLPLVKTMEMFMGGVGKAIDERADDAETDYQRGVLDGLRMALTAMQKVRDAASDQEAQS